MLGSYSQVIISRNTTDVNTTRLPQTDRKFNIQIEYWLFCVPVVAIKLVLLMYIVTWIYFRKRFKLWRDIFCCKTYGQENNRDKMKSVIVDSEFITFDMKSPIYTSEDVRCAFAEVNSVSWLTRRIRGLFSRFSRSPTKKENPIYEGTNILIKEDRLDKYFDYPKLILEDNEVRRHPSENIISLRQLSAKYDAILLQLSAMSCNWRLKRLFLDVPGLLEVINEHFDIPKDKDMFNVILENSACEIPPSVTNYELTHLNPASIFTTYSEDDSNHGKPTKPTSRQSMLNEVPTVNISELSPYYIKDNDELFEEQLARMRDTYADMGGPCENTSRNCQDMES